jgi:hypothetical protein
MEFVSSPFPHFHRLNRLGKDARGRLGFSEPAIKKGAGIS